MTNLYELEYENIHSHSHYSNIMTPDSVIKTEDLAKRAVAMGQKTISTVEHGYFGSIFDYYETAQEYDLKLIFGIEYYFVKDRFEKDRSNSHLLVVAKNEEGRREMTSIMSEANKTGFFYHPRIDEELLFSLTPDNVIVTSACLGSPLNSYSEPEALRFLKRAKEHFGDNFFIEVQPHTNIKQVDFQKKILKYNEEFDFSLILGVDSHYIKLEDDKIRDLFLRGKNIFYPEEDGFTMDYPDVPSIVDRLKEQGVLTDVQIEEAITNTLIVRDFEGVTLNQDIKMPSLYPDKSHEEKVSILKGLINTAWVKDREDIPRDEWPKYIQAIQEEVQIVEETKMEDYFLLNHAIIKRALEEYDGVLTSTGRGSAVSFYINKLLGLTDVDRVGAPITLYPTRFMSKSRILETRSMPDIDLNLADPEPFRKASKDILGDDNSEWMVAYGTMQEAGAFKHYARSTGVDFDEANRVSDDLDRYKNDSEWKDIIDKSSMFRGVIDSVSPHPCSHLLLPSPNTSETTGTIKVKDAHVTLITSDESDNYKYLKNDYLSVTVVDIIQKVYDAIGIKRHTIRELESLVDGDERVWNLYKDGIVATLNQTGTQSGKPQVMQYQPRSVAELSMWVAAIRPGFASLKQEFFDRKEHKYGIDSLDEVLSETAGYMIFQENIMAVLMYSGISEDRTYSIIKGISKKVPDIVDSAKEEFYTGFMNRTTREGYSEEFARETADQVWRVMEDASDYSFNASHAYSVALDSIYGAYLKAYYPLEYYTVVLNIYEGKIDMTSEIVNELSYFDIELSSIEFGKSLSPYTFDKDTNTIYKGINSIKYMNNTVADELNRIYNESEYEPDEFYKVCADLIESSVDSRQARILISLNFFSQFGTPGELLHIYNASIGDKEDPPREDIVEYVCQRRYDKYLDENPKATDRAKEEERKRKFKFPTLYSKSHKDDTKKVRLNNLRVYECIYRRTSDNVIKYSRLIQDEVEYFGYGVTQEPNLPSNVYVVMNINTKYTPVVELYRLQDGSRQMMKIRKNKLYDTMGHPAFEEGQSIQITKTHDEPRYKKVGGDWEEDHSQMQTYIDKIRMANI